ncbi:hypothetical protein [Myxococcus sp. RHSTA-1-4]|uniref:hypothetical protein n=1 Tax=Myxococcus sp. RHSTA-1-4 TaxID=2874601 RepID=UPI001CBF2321|nr:hypothetical protein [Myxococcus sp. RHSTA-1-4]MBZ4420486.1 hypothetical protein [Myxococcus sp. RHSTA-1-4]
MPRSYSFDHFQAKKPMQAAIGTPERLGTDEDKQKLLRGELRETNPEEIPGAPGGLHYGMAHAETVKRLQARRATRAKKEARGAAATKRPAGKRATAKAAAGKTPTARAATAKTPTEERTGRTARAGTEGRASRTAKPATAARKTPKARAETAETGRAGAQAKTPTRPEAKQGLLGRALGTVAKTAMGTVDRGSKGLARAAALAREVRATRGKKKEEKPDTSGGTRGRSGKKR